MKIDDLISLLADVRASLEIMSSQLDLSDVEEQWDFILNGIDLVGIELTHNIAKKIKEK